MHQKILALILAVGILLNCSVPTFAQEGPIQSASAESSWAFHEEDYHSAELLPVSPESGADNPQEEIPPATSEAETDKPQEEIPPASPEPEANKPQENTLMKSEPPIVDSGVPPAGTTDQRVGLCNTLDWNDENRALVDDRNYGIAPRIVGSRLCNDVGCRNYVTVTSKYDKFCTSHRCTISGCTNPRAYTTKGECQKHLGMSPICQTWIGSDVCRKPAVGSYNCKEHWCTSCDGGKEAYELKCEYCYQCWVPKCPKLSTCGNECDTHCPHTCKTHHQSHCLTCHGRGNCCACNTCAHTCKIHHQNHCLTCHGKGNCCACNTCAHTCKTHHQNHCSTCHGKGNCCACNTCAHTCKTHHQNHCLTCHAAPCVCYPVNPTISVSAWNKTNNSITATIASTRATQIEIYTSAGTKVATLNGASGNYAFLHNAAYHNGSYYVRVKNAAGYNSGSFPFIITGLDRAAPATHSVTVTPGGWASSKTITATATDQTNVTLSLQYADGTPVPGAASKETSAIWTISEHIPTTKGFRLVTRDKWGYTSNYAFTVSQIDTEKPTRPAISKTPNVDWHNGAATVKLSGSTAASGIARYEYRVNDGAWTTGASVTLSVQGNYTVEGRAVSGSGLVSDVASIPVDIDTTSPSGSYTLSHQPGKWTTDAITIRFTPTDAGGSDVSSVILPNGQAAPNLSDITYTVSQNGDYAFTVTDNAGNTSQVVVPVEYIAMLDVTVTLNTPFVISPDEDKVYGGDIHFSNHSNVPVRITMQSMTALDGAPAITGPDSRNWRKLSAAQTPKNIAIGYTGNGCDFWVNGEAQSLGTVAKGTTAQLAMKAKHGYAWEVPQSFSYAMTVKVGIDQ